jgi:polygalacturonase
MRPDENRRRFLRTWLAGGALGSSQPAFAESSRANSVQGVFSVRDFGATGIGNALDTRALQSAVDAASLAGGVVYFPPGTYLSGTLFLKSHVSLHFEAGARLLGSTNLADYPVTRPSLRSYTDIYVNQSLIYAENLENVSVFGRGTLDGQGAAFKGGYLSRPFLIRMINCRNVHIADLTLKDSPMWVQHYLGCEDVSIRGLTIHSRCNANNDGIDIDACQKVRISDCEIFSGDDAIAIKSTTDRPCRDVTVTNCVISSLCNGLKLGTESVGGFDNMVFSNCTIYDTRLSGIALETVDGGTLENVSVANIMMRNVKSPIFVRLGNRARPIHKDASKPGLGRLRNVLLRDIYANGADKIGCAIAGLPERSIENLTLTNIRIGFAGGGARTDAALNVPEEQTAYPEYNMFGILPAYGFYCRHLKNLRLAEIQVGVETDELRPALVFDDVEQLKLSDVEAANTSPLLLLRNTRDAWLESNRAPQGNEVYLRLEGNQTDHIFLASNDFRNSKKPLDQGSDVAAGVVLMSSPTRSR